MYCDSGRSLGSSAQQRRTRVERSSGHPSSYSPWSRIVGRKTEEPFASFTSLQISDKNNRTIISIGVFALYNWITRRPRSAMDLPSNFNALRFWILCVFGWTVLLLIQPDDVNDQQLTLWRQVLLIFDPERSSAVNDLLTDDGEAVDICFLRSFHSVDRKSEYLRGLPQSTLNYKRRKQERRWRHSPGSKRSRFI